MNGDVHDACGDRENRPEAGHEKLAAPEAAFCLGLLRRRQCLVPTLRGWALLLACCLAFFVLVLHGLQPFLAPNDPQPGGALVVEGWASDHTLAAAAAEFRTNHYTKLYVTGGPIRPGSMFADYKTEANLGAATLLKLGLTTGEVQAVPAAWVARDRTYSSALSLKSWLREHGGLPERINLLTEGPHARRSRLLFEKALGRGVRVGIIAIPDQDYDPDHWWRTSAGTKTVLGEAIAYAYARFLFWPRDK